MPCRIALLEDEKGQGWLVMMNLDFFIAAADLSPDLKEMAKSVRDNLTEVIQAGANGGAVTMGGGPAGADGLTSCHTPTLGSGRPGMTAG